VRYLTFGPRAADPHVTCVGRRRALRATRLPQLVEAAETWWRGTALLRESDVVTLHLRLSDTSRGLLTARRLALMKPTAFLVNTARAAIVDEQALIDALMNRTIGGAGLDVFEREPLPADAPILRAPNTVLTPHLGYVTRETYDVYFPQALEDIEAWLSGKPIRVITD
jgi:phosphoglycerate dehydrogenase-like enzyme